MKKPRKGRPLLEHPLVSAFIFLLLAIGAVAVYKYVVSGPQPAPPPPQTETAPRQMREVTLYFGAPEGTYLLPEAREIEDCQTDEECLRQVVQALIDGPVGDLVPILPPAELLQTAVVDGTAVLDFSPELISGHPGGSISELLTVYGLADTLAVNFPHIRQVRFLVEGAPVETLKGHMGLREPISADFGLTRPPERILPPENLPAGGENAASDNREGQQQ